MSEICTATIESSDRLSRIKQSMGRTTVRAVTVLASVGTILTGTTIIDSVTGSESVAQAYHITGAEKAWCRWPSRYNLCNQAQAMANVAETEAVKIANKSEWSIADGGADAVRHCTWNGLMAATFGRSTAAGFGNRHEYDDTQSVEQLEMDLHNNFKGRDWATSAVGKMVERCVTGVENGELIRLTN